MSQRRKRIQWGVGFIAGCTAIGLSIAWAQKPKTPKPETLLPAGSIVYVGFDGNDEHADAWKKTAAYEALYETGLIDVVKKLFKFASETAEAESGGVVDADAFKDGFDLILKKGASLAVTLPDGPGDPIPSATIVLHEAAKLAPGLDQLIKASGGAAGEFKTKTISGRKVTSAVAPLPNGDTVEVGWWTEGNHLVVVAGKDALKNAIAVATGKTPNITTNPLWKKYRGKEDFEVTFVGWADLGALRKKFGGERIPIPDPDAPPLTVNGILKALGLDTVGAFAIQSGYKDRAMWSETTLEAPGPKRGLLALGSQKSIKLTDLPPLPFSTNGFYAGSCDWSKLYDDSIKIAKDVAALGPPDAAAEVDAAIAAAPKLIGIDPKKDLLDPLGNVVCVYGDTRQGSFGMGVGLVVKVDDPKTLKSTLNGLAGIVAELVPADEMTIRRTKKHGRDIITFEIAGGVFNPSFVVDDDWLAVGLFPQTVEAFLLRIDEKLSVWKPSSSYRDGFAEMPKEFTSLTVSDPRKSYRTIMGWAPVVMGMMMAGAKQGGILPEDAQAPVSVADLPPAELVARPLFPNILMTTVDDEGFHWTSRTSLPGIPFIGMMGVTTAPIAVALLLPAVQQARAAARRSKSMNNLKQIAIAMHNYADTFGEMPTGTVANANLKPEKRLSWMVPLLPYVEQNALARQIDKKAAWDSKANSRPLSTRIQIFQHPAAGEDELAPNESAPTHYVGIAGVGKDTPTLKMHTNKTGIFGYNRKIRFRDITDGTSNTMAVTEAVKNKGGWGAGGKATIRALTKKPYINGPDGLAGQDKTGLNVMMMDGSVRFLSSNVDPSVMEALATVRGGEVINR